MVRVPAAPSVRLRAGLALRRATLTRDWIARLSAAGAAMEAALPALVADERDQQRRDGVRASPDAQLTLVSEFGWLLVPELGETIGVRDVRDGRWRAGLDSEVRLHDLLAGEARTRLPTSEPCSPQVRDTTWARSERNFNFPTFPLIYLRPGNRRPLQVGRRHRATPAT